MSVQARPSAGKAPETAGTPLIKLEGVKKYFPVTRGIIFQQHVGDVHAVDGLDLELYPGETLVTHS